MFDIERAKGRVRKVFDNFRNNYVRSGGNLSECIGFSNVGEGESITLETYMLSLEEKELAKIKHCDFHRVGNTEGIKELIEKEIQSYTEGYEDAAELDDKKLEEEYVSLIVIAERALVLMDRYKLPSYTFTVKNISVS